MALMPALSTGDFDGIAADAQQQAARLCKRMAKV
jgi:hypothetical protein